MPLQVDRGSVRRRAPVLRPATQLRIYDIFFGVVFAAMVIALIALAFRLFLQMGN